MWLARYGWNGVSFAMISLSSPSVRPRRSFFSIRPAAPALGAAPLLAPSCMLLRSPPPLHGEASPCKHMRAMRKRGPCRLAHTLGIAIIAGAVCAPPRGLCEHNAYRQSAAACTRRQAPPMPSPAPCSKAPLLAGRASECACESLALQIAYKGASFNGDASAYGYASADAFVSIRLYL